MNVAGSSWVTEGYESWLASFDNACSFSHRIQSKKETTVILLGLTQNGKTTLALRLLDALEPEGFGKALRGGRIRGQSATPGPIAYISSTSTRETNYKSIENKIAKIFSNYNYDYEQWLSSKNSDFLDSPPTIEVPSSNPESPFTIVDMAGFGGRESWAELAADYWTARADYTILVIQAEYLSQFKEEGDFASVYRRLMNRLIHSHSLLVVTTYSIEQKIDSSEESFIWVDVKEKMEEYFYKVVNNPCIEQSQIEVYPVSFAPKESAIYELACILNNESILKLKKKLSEETILTRISNARVLRADREVSLLEDKKSYFSEKEIIKANIKELKENKDAVLEYEKELKEDKLPSFFIDNYPLVSAVGEEDFHDILSKDWPEKAYKYYDDSLNNYFEEINRHFNYLLKKSNLLLKEDPFINTNKNIWREVLPESLGFKIRKDLFHCEKRHFLIFKKYDSESSTKELYARMTDRRKSLYSETMNLSNSLREMVSSRISTVKNILLKQKFAREKKMDSLEIEKKNINDKIKDVDVRRANLPQIPDLVSILRKCFIKEWNQILLKVNCNSSTPKINEIAINFIGLWEMKEWIEIIAKRFNKNDHIYSNSRGAYGRK